MTLSQYRPQHFISSEFLSPVNSASEGMKSYAHTERCPFTGIFGGPCLQLERVAVPRPLPAILKMCLRAPFPEALQRGGCM